MFVLQVFSFISCLSQPWSKLVPCSPTVFSVVCFLLFTSGVCVCVICRSVVSSEFVHVKSCCRVLLSAHDCPLTLKCWFNSGIKLLFISLVLVLFEQRVHDDIIVVSAMRSSSLLQWCHHHYCSNDVIIICGNEVIIRYCLSWSTLTKCIVTLTSFLRLIRYWYVARQHKWTPNLGILKTAVLTQSTFVSP